jgi:hypothetical protein
MEGCHGDDYGYSRPAVCCKFADVSKENVLHPPDAGSTFLCDTENFYQTTRHYVFEDGNRSNDMRFNVLTKLQFYIFCKTKDVIADIAQP